MERAAWTDERLDDLSKRMDVGFDRVDKDMRELRVLIFQLWGSTVVAAVTVVLTIILRT
jgi:hypothetical protein